MLRRIAPWRERLGLGPGSPPPHPEPRFEAQLAVLIEDPPPVFSFTFGIPPADALDALRAAGAVAIGTATTAAEAAALEEAGCAAIVAQGSEAGGHRGSFAVAFEAAMVGTIALVPQVVDRVDVPVLAAGGIMDGRGIAAALALGAGGVQMGTAFIGCTETGAPPAYVSSLEESEDASTTVTRAFTGRPARALRTRWVEEVEALGSRDPAIPGTGDAARRAARGRASSATSSITVMRLAGQGAPMIRRGSASALVAALVDETDAALRPLR